MSVFTARDVLSFAVRIEENGAAFYRKAAGLMKSNEAAKRLFEKLEVDEGQHREIFSRILSSISQGPVSESYPGEYAAYLKHYVDNALIFKEEKLAQEVSGIRDLAGFIAFAMERELDSILYYQEIKGLVAKNDHALLDRIIAEERRHVVQLAELKGGDSRGGI
jgi:rubrerythrin